MALTATRRRGGHRSGHHPGRRARDDALAGVATMAPFVVAYLPFAVVIGSTAAAAHAAVPGWAGSWLIYGGSAHLAALHGIADGTGAVAVVTALLVNARLVLYGSSMAPYWRTQPRWFRLVAPAMLIDSTWAAALRHAPAASSDAAHRRYVLAAGLTVGIPWSAGVAVGALVGSRLPDVGLELAAPLVLVALLGPRLRERGHAIAAATAGAIALTTSSWPAGTGIVAAICIGCAVSRRWDAVP